MSALTADADQEVLWNRARALKGCSDERIDCLEDLIVAVPSHARAKSLLAILLANKGGEKNILRALDLARVAVDLRPEDTPLRIALGRLADGDEKLSALKGALRLEPDNLEALCLLLTASPSFGNEEENLYIRIKQNIKDTDVDYHYALGAFFRRKDPSKCKYHYVKVVAKMDGAESDPKGLCDKARFWLCTLGNEGGGEVPVSVPELCSAVRGSTSFPCTRASLQSLMSSSSINSSIGPLLCSGSR